MPRCQSRLRRADIKLVLQSDDGATIKGLRAIGKASAASHCYPEPPHEAREAGRPGNGWPGPDKNLCVLVGWFLCLSEGFNPKLQRGSENLPADAQIVFHFGRVLRSNRAFD